MIENLDVFFLGLDAADMVFHTSPSRTVRAYFDNAFQDVNLGETIMDTTIPRLTAKWSDVRDIPRGTAVSVTSQHFSGEFSTIQLQPEGTGLATITLGHE
jgi:hypothetical protein